MAFLTCFPTRGLGRKFRAVLAVGIAAVFSLGVAAAQMPDAREYQIKAAFILNFVQFVKWPPAAFASSGAPITVGVLGDDPFGNALDETLQGEAVDGRRFAVIRSRSVDLLKDCQVIFISRSEQGHAAEIIAQLQSRPTLTIGDMEGFVRQGGEIDFYLSGDKVRFEINPDAARQHGLKVSSQLLSLGKLAKP